jgi:hypothetical protein
VKEKEHLKLVALYDANRNEYFILWHNQSAEEAETFVAKWQPYYKPGFSTIVLDQTNRHCTQNSEDCRTCRDIVARSANINPKPKFKRRDK